MHFAQFAEQLETIKGQRARRDKAKTLSQLFEPLDSSELPAAIYLCQGRLAETWRRRQQDHIHLSQKRVASLLKQQGHQPAPAVSSKHDDALPDPATPTLLETLFHLYRALHTSVAYLDAWLAQKQPLPSQLAELARRLGDRELVCLSRILTGPLIKDEVIISALAARFVPAAVGVENALWQAYRYTLPDLGAIATAMLETPKTGRYWALIEMTPQPSIPLKPQEIACWDSVEAAWQAMGRCYVQPKHNGRQIQIHKEGDAIRLFDRKLEDLTSQLPGVVQACRTQISAETAILDSEVVGYDPAAERILPWDQTLAAPEHRVLVFDVMLLDGEDQRGEIYRERRRRLVQLLPGDDRQDLCPVPEEFIKKQKELEEIYDKWSAHGDSEGVILIKPGGHYLSGRLSKEKAKLKPYLSLDVVVLGYRVSAKGLPSFYLGVWDEKGSKLIPVGWAEGAIVRPCVRQELWKLCQALGPVPKPAEIANDRAPRAWVRPRVVVEVTVEGRTRDGSYKHAGFRLYRKKAVRIRDDLEIKDADNLIKFLALPLPPGEQA